MRGDAVSLWRKSASMRGNPAAERMATGTRSKSAPSFVTIDVDGGLKLSVSASSRSNMATRGQSMRTANHVPRCGGIERYLLLELSDEDPHSHVRMGVSAF